MSNRFSSKDRRQIKEAILKKYTAVAAGTEGNFSYLTGRAGLEAQSYDPEILKELPEDVVASFCGVGNPFALGPIREGERVVDIGCGAGVDSIVAAMMVGHYGIVVGIDLTPGMLEQARENSRKVRLGNVNFLQASAERLPIADRNFDVVISNGVFNLVPDKTEALREAFRILRPGGRVLMADQILTVRPPDDIKTMVDNWAK